MPSRAPWTVGSAMTYIPDDDPDYPFEGLSIFDADGDQVAIVPIDLFIGLAQVTENAQLIAAAPDLLAACKALIETKDKDLPLNEFVKALVLMELAVLKVEAQL